MRKTIRGNNCILAVRTSDSLERLSDNISTDILYSSFLRIQSYLIKYTLKDLNLVLRNSVNRRKLGIIMFIVLWFFLQIIVSNQMN